MRITIVSQYYLPQPLANAEVVGGLARNLAGMGHQVDVVTPTRSTEEPPGVTVRSAFGYFPTDRASTAKRVVEYLTFSAGALLTGSAGPRPDVVLVLSPPPTLGAVGLLIGRIRRAPVVYVVQDLYPEVAIATGAVTPGPALAALGRLMRFVYRRCAAVVVIDEGLVTAISSIEPRARVHAVRNGIDLAPFADSRRDAKWLESVGIDPGRPVVMYAGNVGRSQDLRAVARATARCGAQLLIHGGGAALETLRADAARQGWDHLRFSGFVDRSELGTVFGSADLHAVPLKPDVSAASVPSKLLSILAAGRPAVVAAEAGSAAARLLAESDAGWLVAPGDEESLTATLRSALADPAELERRGQLGLAWAAANAGSDRCAAEYEAVLEQAVQRR